MRYVIHNYIARRTVDSDFSDALTQAQNVDPLGYSRGLAKLTFVSDIDNHWNASYEAADDQVTIADKFHNKPFVDKVQTLIHEFGHRGQKVDPDTYKAYRAQKLDKLFYFLAMANKVHLEDYRKNGIPPEEMADEIFAESYARYAMGQDMPKPLWNFWHERVGR